MRVSVDECARFDDFQKAIRFGIVFTKKEEKEYKTLSDKIIKWVCK